MIALLVKAVAKLREVVLVYPVTEKERSEMTKRKTTPKGTTKKSPKKPASKKLPPKPPLLSSKNTSPKQPSKLGEALRRQGVKKLPQRKDNPLKLRPELLLHPNIPKPLHGVNPRTIYGTNWWNRTRLLVYKSTEFHCAACGVHKTEARSRQWLEAHEIYEVDYQKGIATFVEAVPLCNLCHMYIHDGRLTHLLEKGLIHHYKFVQVIKHGDAVLKRAGLERTSHRERELAVQALEASGKLAKWASWRLSLDGKLYEPIYKSYAEWVAAMNNTDVGTDDE